MLTSCLGLVLQIHCRESETSVSKVRSPRLWTPSNRHLPPSDPLSAPLCEVLALGNESLMDRTGQRRDALVLDLVAEVLARDAGRTREEPTMPTKSEECRAGYTTESIKACIKRIFNGNYADME